MRDIENILKTHIQNDEANTFAIIVPTDSARLKRQRELVGYHPNRAVADLRVYTLGSLIQRLYDQVRPSRQYISQGLQNLWLHEIVDPQSDTSDTYRYEAFRPSQDLSVPDSTLSLVVDTINHLRERGETALNIVADNPTKVDLVHIYENYEAKLADQWIDEQGKHLHLANNFNSEFMRNAFPQVNLVVVEGFTVLSKADIKILTGIAGMPNIEMWFRTDYVEENENLYRNIADLVRQFEAVGVDIDADYERESDLHQHFAKNLFRVEAEDVNLNHNSDAAVQIKVLKPADRSEEVEQIAHLIQKHVSDGDCKLSDICVAYYNIGQYQQRIAETFPAYGIPYSLVEIVPLTRSEIVKAIFSRLSSRQVPLDGAYFSEVEPASHTRLFHPDAFQRYVDDLLKEGEVIQHILNPMLRKNREVVEGEIEAYRQFNRIVKELCGVLKSDGVESCSLDDYIEKLHHIAKHTNYQNRPATKAETVRIVQLGELRSLEFDVVFLGDFVEGRFPANYQPDPLLPEIPYRNEEEQLHDSRFMFYRVLKSFRKVLYLLTPKRERAADLIPSPFLGQLKALADVQEIEIADPTQGSTSGFLSTYSNHVWTSPVPSNENFPAEIAEMRPLINHVVMVEKSRENTHDHLDYEGVLTVETLSAVNRRRLERRREHIYSVTELEIYAKCPFQYFINNVLKFRVEEDETEDELSGLERGSLLHDVLFEFYNNRRNQKRPPIGQCSEEAFKEAKAQLNELLDSNAEKKRNRRKEKLIGENNLFWETDIEKLRIALHKWLAAERTYGLPVTPRYFEVSFGQERELRYPELSCREPITIGDVRMTGKIDRIDIGNGTFNIVDYKTGSSTVRMPEILSGRSLQLPIYLQTAKKLLEMHGETGLEPAAGLYYKVRLDQFNAELGIGTESQNGDAYNAYNGRDWRPVSSRSGQLLADETFDARLARVSGYIQHYVDSISKGTFPLITRVETFVDSEEEGDTPITPRNKTEPCNYCSYKRVCRVGAISEVTQSDD
jgi:ATP-dependent helicase/DNAse subunit B